MVHSQTRSDGVLPKRDILHEGRLGSFSPSAAKYTSSIDIDHRLLPAVVAINMAHVLMLSERSVITREDAADLMNWLGKVPKDLKMKETLEDVHMNVEDYVISKVGSDTGGMLNLGKSRNDQVATALRMALRNQLIAVGSAAISLEKSLLSQAARNNAVFMPGYTHLQRGQPVTVGHHLLAHFDALDRDFSRLVDCYLRVNQSPMGSGALASTGIPIDRKRVAQLLGFDSLMQNSLDAVSSRDFATEAIYVCTQIMIDLSRLAEEIVIWTTKEFAFAEISDKHASTSSMMPQKKNAVVPEIFRAKASQVLGDLVGSIGIIKSLPLSYNLDLQELTRNLWSAVDKTSESLQMLSELINEIKFNNKTLEDATSDDDFLYATELADYLVVKFKLPFREAHNRVGALVRHCSSDLKLTSRQFRSLDEGTLAKILGVKLTAKQLKDVVQPSRVLSRRTSVGSPNPKMVEKQCNSGLLVISNHEGTLNLFRGKIEESQKTLRNAASRLEKYAGVKKEESITNHQKEVKE
ncbi:MAG: argininosuccinate lyase [Thaumarchaeota archaeon]|nr:argininosuccinate lyase [Nitrososphaerota archaeon]